MKQVSVHIFRVIIVYLGVHVASVQGQSCPEKVETSRKYYREGQFHLIPALLEECLENKQLTREKQIDAHRILANMYYVLDSIELADHNARGILNISSGFEADEVDVFGLRQNIERLKKVPMYEFGINGGFILPSVTMSDVYNDIFDGENASTNQEISTNDILQNINEDVGYSIGAVVNRKVSRNLMLESGIGYQSFVFVYFQKFREVNKETRVSDLVVPLFLNYRTNFQISQNQLGLQAGFVFTRLMTWKNSDRLGEKLSNDTSDLRQKINAHWLMGIYYDMRFGNTIIRPGIQYVLALGTRSRDISGKENAALVYNNPAFINYDARIHYLKISVSLLKQKF